MTQIPASRFDAYPDEASVLDRLKDTADLSPKDRADIASGAAGLVARIRKLGRPGLMEVFLAEYGLSTEEGIALMCLAEALLRVPDADTIDALIEDKIAPSDWGKHLGHSSSSLVNASTWALMLTGRVLDEGEPGLAGALRHAVKRLGEPVIRAAALRAMKEMGQQFVLGESMTSALARASKMEAQGYTYSYDMLGEAAWTMPDADRYFDAYADAIRAAGDAAKGTSVRTRPGISVKLSALHPRYQIAQRDRVIAELTPRLAELTNLAADRNIGLNIDAEEADRLELSLDVIEKLLTDHGRPDWEGLGIVVQAYGLRAGPVLDHIHELSKKHGQRLMVRLVKGAYWDTEIKRAQVAGLERFPVFTAKSATDMSYVGCARKLLGMTDRIYPQFATHNAHTAMAVLHMADDPSTYEFQRLHGMGEHLHDLIHKENGTACRIYAPVGAHRDLLAYLVRRLLENGANSSFVNQVVDEDVPPEVVASDPFEASLDLPGVTPGDQIFAPERPNSKGWDITDIETLHRIEEARAPFKTAEWSAAPLTAFDPETTESEPVFDPSHSDVAVGRVANATEATARKAVDAATAWSVSANERADVLRKAADLYEAHYGEFFALLAREAGKSIADAVSELREAVDFLRYYAQLAPELNGDALGTVTCVSPWNFPLAIFTGQIAGALSAGNAVLAKPAEQTPLVAHRAVELLHEAGVPRSALQYLPGDGASVGRVLTSTPGVDGVAFTGSTYTARLIRRAMAENLAPGAALVAETGGINAMIVDSTALPEQAIRDVIASAFQSAGQRCSALRCLYVQKDVAPHFRDMLLGAMDELRIGDPWDIATDVGPVIDAEARDGIERHIAKGKIVKRLDASDDGTFVAPTVLEVGGIRDIAQEIFGPVLHLATFDADDLEKVIRDVNSTGYGLTFGLHTRIDTRVQDVVEAVHAGNVYVNRNQIGAVVGSQPFGGEGLSGTGPKAGGPWYPRRFQRSPDAPGQAGDIRDMAGPTGESNRLSRHPRAPIWCLGPGAEAAEAQARAVEALGGIAHRAADAAPEALATADHIGGAVFDGTQDAARDLDKALAGRGGPLVPLITGGISALDVLHERHLCIDTTASGGNAQLLAEVADAA